MLIWGNPEVGSINKPAKMSAEMHKIQQKHQEQKFNSLKAVTFAISTISSNLYY